ncbi:hypothetical protein [Cimodo virus]|uniref:hypothetical protein n=1 Tax=Cimodo virus TaxID=1427476 RepID=UPI0003E7729D|nr:hypothetical protein [Cimodo virus]AHF20707.1 hypothetical protein [Cimodo virus]
MEQTKILKMSEPSANPDTPTHPILQHVNKSQAEARPQYNPSFYHLQYSSGRFPIDETLYKATREHFGSAKDVDYFILPAKKVNGEYQFMPCAVSFSSKFAIPPGSYADSSERMLHTLFTGAEPTEIDILSFVDDFSVVHPGLAKLTAKMDDLAAHVSVVNQQHAFALHSAISHVSYQTQAQCASLASQLEDLKTIIAQGRHREEVAAVTYSESETTTLIPSLVAEHKNTIIERSKSISSATSSGVSSASESIVSVTSPTHSSTSIEQKLEAPTITLARQSLAVRTNSDPTPSLSWADEVDFPSLPAPSTDRSQVDLRDLRPRRGVRKIKDLVDVAATGKIELIDQACFKPQSIQKYCDAEDGVKSPIDLHVARFSPSAKQMENSEGVLYATYHIKGCSDSPYTMHLIVKDDRGLADYQGKNGVAIDFVSTRNVLQYLGFQDVYANIASIPMVREIDGFKSGLFAGRYGSFQRRRYSEHIDFYRLGVDVTKKIMSHSAFEDVVEYAHHKMIDLLSQYSFDDVPEFIELPSITKIFPTGESNKEIASVAKNVAHLGRKLPNECVSRIPQCVQKCWQMKGQRHGLMHGAHVLYSREKNSFFTPCGETVTDAVSYWKHPCTVRARTVALQAVHPEETKDLARTTSLREGTPCSVCGRRYLDRADSILCSVFCILVQHGQLDKEKKTLKLPRRIPPVGAFGHSVKRVSVPSRLSID